MKIYKTFVPKVSVIIPTFNRGNTIERAIVSVLNQTIKDIEIIVVDDGSTDDTASVVKKIISEHEQVRYMYHQNKMVALSMNTGIQAAVGEYIGLLGSDDEYKPNYIEQRYEYMIANPEVDLLHGGVDVIGNPYVKDKNDLTKKIHLNDCTIGGTFFAKRKMYLETGGFNDLSYSTESELFARMEGKYNITKVDWPTYIYYRNTPGSITNTIT